MILNRMTFALWGVLLFCSPSPAPAQEAGEDEPDIAALAKAGRGTLDRLERQAASWTATSRLSGEARALVDVLATPTMRRTVLSIEAQGRRAEVFRITVRDGIWYATEGTKAGKYRPYEAPFDLPTAYYFLARSEPQCVVQDQRAGLGVYEGTQEGKATYRTPLAEPMRQQLRQALDEMEQLMRREPERAAKPEVGRAVERMRDLLRRGIPVKVEVATGMLLQFGAADKQTEIRDFRWLDRVAAEEFGVEGKNWEDSTGDPTLGGTSDLLMMSHSGIWRPGQKSGDTDGRLVDLRTGRYRRIPFRGGNALPGCFLRGRTRVVVSGFDALEGVMGLYEVDLRTGENRRLGGDLLASGFTLMPALSPDGKTIAVLHKGASGRLLYSQVCLVDLETGEARRLGEPGDMAYLSWLPDGQGLVLLRREVADPSDVASPRTDTIARMDLGGRVTKVREGSSPVLLGDGRTILFQDAKSRAWLTCDLDGGAVKAYAGGMAGYGFPAPAPDGKRILMMHFRQGLAPEPTVLAIGEADGKPAVAAPGLWATPAWR